MTNEDAAVWVAMFSGPVNAGASTVDAFIKRISIL